MTLRALQNLPLDRPLAVFDIESTGPNARTDRIIELAILKVMPDHSVEQVVFTIKPGIPIPIEAFAIHGISDAAVAGCPTFPQVAGKIQDVLRDCDLCGYNLIRFDIPMLEEEFIRAGMKFEIEGRRIIDPQRIYHRREPRDLTAALAFYCNEAHAGAHGAEADARATLSVLEGQLARYPDLPHDMTVLDDYCGQRHPNWVDRTGKLRWHNGEVVINFGRKKDTSLRTLINEEQGFIKWLLNSDFPRDFHEIIENARKGTWPVAKKIAPQAEPDEG